MVQNSTPKFAIPNESFAQELRKQVNLYFHSNNLSKFGGKKIFIKAVLLGILFIANYFLWVFYDTELWVKILLSISLGMITSFIGFNVMHDGAHHSFNKNKFINEAAGYSLNFLGANVFLWKTKHNVIHHTYTNIPDVDYDIDAGIFLLLNPNKKRYWFHRFQHIYFPFVYAFLYLYWVFYADYHKYFTKKIHSVKILGFTTKEKVIFWLSKIFHLFVFVILPVYELGFNQFILQFLIYTFTTGLVLSIVFQLAHIVEETEFILPDNQNTMPDEWMKHQLKTTANFAMNNKVLTFLLGGLNYQIEHHLFPTISHIHYPKISPIVQRVCNQFNVPYFAHPNLALAIQSHYTKLKMLGRNSL
jgi:linoleoyl-CoA desaturase